MQHTLGLAFQRAALGHCVLNELHKVTGKNIYLSIYIYIYKYSICPLTCNAVRFMLCWFTGVFGILLVLACFGLLFHFLMLSMQFLLLASHFHFPSVLDLCVIFLLLPNLSLRSFFNDKIAHICGAVAFIPGAWQARLDPHRAIC